MTVPLAGRVRMPAIQAADLVKEFSRPAVLPGRLPRLRALFSTKREITRAVNGVNFEIEPGELVGYLGPNAPASRPRSRC